MHVRGLARVSRRTALALVISLSGTIAAAQTPAIDSAPVAEPVADHAETSAPVSRVMPRVADLFTPLPGDLRLMTTQNNLLLAGVGGLGAMIGRTWDRPTASTPWGGGFVSSALEPGELVGNFLVQSGGALATYGVGRLTGSPRVATLGASIFRAQVTAQVTAQAIKFAARRTRPDGTSHSFPSGHSAAAFATATVLHSELGWKASVPAYAVATWVAASRVQMRRHFVSDVIAGATVGILAGRSVTVGRGSTRFAVAPSPMNGGFGVSFTKVAH